MSHEEELRETIAFLERGIKELRNDIAVLSAACDSTAVERNVAVQQLEFMTADRDRTTAELDRLNKDVALLSAACDSTAVERNLALRQLEDMTADRDRLIGELSKQRYGVGGRPEPSPGREAAEDPQERPRPPLAEPHPGKPRILFIGWPISSHTTSWIDLFDRAPFNCRLFALPVTGTVGVDDAWEIPTYVTSPSTAVEESPFRRQVFPPSADSPAYLAYLSYEAKRQGLLVPGKTIDQLMRRVDRIERALGGEQSTTLEHALAKVILEWRPDVVHTLGLDPASYLYFHTLKNHPIEGISKWVVQARGGPDLALNPVLPDHRQEVEAVMQACDYFIADNPPNYERAIDLGLAPEKASSTGIGVVSGPGGLDVDALHAMAPGKPSERERLVLWPKAYETMTAKGVPVLEAIVKYWDRLQPCRIEMLWFTQPEMKIWFDRMVPEHIRASCIPLGRLSREDTLQRMSRARVLLAPSLSDGVPNTMLEAMAMGAAPIVSPLETIAPIVRDEENVLFARNLYVDEIGEALVRALNDDALVDRMAAANLIRVRELADRDEVRRRVVSFYEAVTRGPA